MNRDVFPAVEPASPVHGDLERLRAEVAADCALVPGDGDRVRAELLAGRAPDGTVAVRRFLWSVQRPEPALPGGLAARTLVRLPVHETGGPGAPGHAPASTTWDFPTDPVLGGIADTAGRLAVHPAATAVDVLRYIPLRRVTVRLHGLPGLPDRVVAKVQTPADLRAAHAVLGAVARAVARADSPPFRVPGTLGLDAGDRLLLLTELPGRPLSRALDAAGGDDDDAMGRLGAVHAALHGLDVAGLTTRDVRDAVRSAERAAAQVATLLPSLTPRLTAVVHRLSAGAPPDVEPVFCQGDLVPSQILCDPTGWSVLDLDDAHLADPYSEVAALWVALPRELSVKDPARADRLREAYLRSYRDHRARAWDEQRWRWHVAVARLRLAARRVTKGRAVPGETEAALEDLDTVRSAR